MRGYIRCPAGLLILWLQLNLVMYIHGAWESLAPLVLAIPLQDMRLLELNIFRPIKFQLLPLPVVPNTQFLFQVIFLLLFNTNFLGDGIAFGCGTSDSGQLGTGKRDTELLPRVLSTSQMEPVSSAACGNSWTFIVTTKGSVWSTGANNSGQLGLGHKKGVISFVPIVELTGILIKKISAGHHTAALSVEGDLYFWGTGVFGETLVPRKVTSITSKVKDLSVGGSFGVALDGNGKVWTWGANTSGELGVGDYEPRSEPFYLSRLQNKTVISVSCGGSFAIALGVTHSTGGPTELLEPASDSKKFLASPNALTAQFAPSAMLEEDSKGNTDQGKKLQSEERSEADLDLQYTPVPTSGRKMNPLNMNDATPSISDLNGGEGSSSVSQRDPNQHLLTVLTRQRDYLEESLEKERKEKKRLEDANASLKGEVAKLKNYVEQIEGQKAKEVADATMMLGNLTAAKQRLDEMEYKIAELENNNELLSKILKEKETQLGESNRNKEDLTKKYNVAKKKLRAHVDIQEKLAKENENLLQKIKKAELEYEAELDQIKEVNSKQAEKISELESQLQEVTNASQKHFEKLKEFDLEAGDLRGAVEELQERLENAEGEKEALQEELGKQKALSSQYENDLRFLEKEFEVLKEDIEKQNDSIKSELIAEKCKSEDLAYTNQQQSAKIAELQVEKETLAQKLLQLEDELKDSLNKLNQFKKLNEELEERNYKLMDTLHQDVAKRSKQYKGKTLAALAQSEAHKLLNQMRDPATFRNEGDPRFKAGSPPQSLVVEATDDAGTFDMLRKSNKQSPVLLAELSLATSLTGSSKSNLQVKKYIQK
eukprot:TRINITY_DN3178_c0_g1_i1.p1 TRINITY_DN3178_c0_g1~~TRINITY_DN3178_c0_g1_i1.p1  ORF type:complete len:827 (-),score=129.89 TRINITY_DN3178_c0_g1_i1:9584-12064(-)